MGPKMDPKLVPKWSQYGPDLVQTPIWTRIPKGVRMAPTIAARGGTASTRKIKDQKQGRLRTSYPSQRPKKNVF